MTTIENKLADLAPRIEKTAVGLSYRSGLDADDIAQAMRLAIVEHSRRDPSILDQTDAYIVKLGRWRALDLIRRDYRRTNRDISEAEGDDWTIPASVNPWPDVERRLILAQVARDLDDDLRAVFDCLAAGLGIAETARDLGVHRSTITARCKRIAARIRA